MSKVSTIYVLDSWPILEMLRENEPAASKTIDFLSAAASSRLVMSWINAGEVFYKCVHYFGEAQAYAAQRLLQNQIEFMDVNGPLILEAALLKSRFPIAYADCFAAALAIRLNCPVVTGDPDFLKLQEAGLLSVEWLAA